MSNRKAEKKKQMVRMICLAVAVVMVVTVLVAALLNQ